VCVEEPVAFTLDGHFSHTSYLDATEVGKLQLKLPHYTSRRRLGREEGRYSSYSFSISAIDGGEWSASLPGRALAPEKGPPVRLGGPQSWSGHRG
jgi:hypothetical protein